MNAENNEVLEASTPNQEVLITEVITKAKAMERARVTQGLGEITLSTIQSMVNDNNLDNDIALEVYNAIADACGYPNVDSLTKKFAVTIRYNNCHIMTIHDVEADDEESAVDKVVNDGSYEVSAKVSFTYDGYQETIRTDITDFVSWEDLDIEAEEQ